MVMFVPCDEAIEARCARPSRPDRSERTMRWGRSTHVRREPTADAVSMRSERGASAIEVALLIAVIAIVCIGALKALGGDSDDTLVEAAEATANEPAAPSGGGSGSGGGSTGGGGGGGGATTTSAAPTTTTTAAPTTTTSAAPATTTTTMPPLGSGYPSSSGFQTPTVQTNSNGQKRASTSVVVRGTDGTPIPNATVVVEIARYQRSSSGSFTWKTEQVTLTTGANGAVTVTPSSYYTTSGTTRVTQMRFTIVSSTASGWDGTKTPVTQSLV
jgi:Flp pilus assembly pilin Flp